MTAREQAGMAIMACSEEAAVLWQDPQWARRRRHGDPTLHDDLLARACARVGLDAQATRSVQALVRQDAAFRQLFESSLAVAGEAAAQESRSRRRRVVIITLAVAALMVCLTALAVFSFYQHEVAQHGGHGAARE